MSTLMSFIHNSMLPRLNDPTNTRLWLPGLLAGMNQNGNPVLPIRSDAQDLGFLEGEHGGYVAERFVQTWSIMNQKDAVADPLQPFPSLKLSDVTLGGLQNVHVQQVSSAPTISGYDASVTLLPNYYPSPTQGLEMPLLTLTGRYQIEQSLWVEDSYKTAITGVGAFSATFSDCLLNAPLTLTTTGSAAQRSSAVTLLGLTLTGIVGDEPTLQFDDLTLEGDLEQSELLILYIKQALNAPDGRMSMLTTVAEMLNAPDNLESMSSSLSEYLTNSLDELFSVVPQNGLPIDNENQQGATVLDVYLFDRLRLALNQPDSEWYLPRLLSDSTAPVLEPYQHAQVVIPDQTLSGLNYTDIELNDLNIAGFSNAFMPLETCILSAPIIAMEVLFGMLPEGDRVSRQALHSGVPPAPPVKLTTWLSLTQQGVTPVNLQGVVFASLFDCRLHMNLNASGDDVSDLDLTVNALSFVWGSEPVEFNVELEPRNSVLESMLQKMLLKPEIQNPLKVQLAEALTAQRCELSASFSRLARAIIINQLS